MKTQKKAIYRHRQRREIDSRSSHSRSEPQLSAIRTQGKPVGDLWTFAAHTNLRNDSATTTNATSIEEPVYFDGSE